MKNLYILFRKYAISIKDIPLLGMRLILANVFWTTGMEKWNNIEGTIWWFENSLGIPFPTFNAYMAAGTELISAVLLLLGFATRLISIPLTFVLIIAMMTVHYTNGWLAIASSISPEVAERLSRAKEILKENGNYDWLTETGSFVILNNGVEFVVMYIMFLLILLSSGAGKVSIDFIINKFSKK